MARIVMVITAHAALHAAGQPVGPLVDDMKKLSKRAPRPNGLDWAGKPWPLAKTEGDECIATN